MSSLGVGLRPNDNRFNAFNVAAVKLVVMSPEKMRVRMPHVLIATKTFINSAIFYA